MLLTKSICLSNAFTYTSGFVYIHLCFTKVCPYSLLVWAIYLLMGTITILVPRIDLNNPGTDVYNSGQAVFTKLGPRTHLLQFSYFRMYHDCKALPKLQFSYLCMYHDCNYGSYTILLFLIYNYTTFTRIAVCLDVLTQGSPSVLMSSRKDPDDRRLS